MNIRNDGRENEGQGGGERIPLATSNMSGLLKPNSMPKVIAMMPINIAKNTSRRRTPS